jgi:hypothetical protein
MIKVPGEKPFVPPISAKEIKPDKGAEEKPVRPSPPLQAGTRSVPEMDTHAIATRLAALAVEAKERELKFEEIIQRVIEETGVTNPQSAMEEANRKLQKEIEDELVKIKENKELMEEAESWQEFANALGRMNREQVEGFLGLLKETIRSFA